jgi:hypothetical protein
MANQDSSLKRVAISKANAQMVAVLAVASFVTVFCLFAAKAVWSNNSYQSRVVTKKELALNTLKKNIETFDDLSKHYSAFNETPTNLIGGVNNGTGDNDGSNSKLILDALPSNYDFPALTSSLEKILNDSKLKITTITGTDDQLNQEGTPAATAKIQPVAIPFSFTVGETNYNAVRDLIKKLERSIRPIQIDNIDASGGGNNMTVTINGHTYFQPATKFSVTKETVK